MAKMPWGKFQGKMLHEVPDDYLKWFMERDHGGIGITEEWIKKAIREEMETREKSGYFIPAE